MLIKKRADHWRIFSISGMWYWDYFLYLLHDYSNVERLQAVDIRLGLELIAGWSLVMIWESPPSSTLLGYVPTMTVMLGHLGHVFPFICTATEIDVSQAPHPPSATHNTDPALHQNLQRFTRPSKHNVFWNPKGNSVLHLYNCIQKKKKKSNCCSLTWTAKGNWLWIF